MALAQQANAPPEISAAPAWYSAAQAERGRALVRVNCEPCHGAGLLGGDAPAISGPELFANWPTAQSLYEFYSFEMPPFAPGQLGETAYVEIMAYILSLNGYPAGETELTADPELLERIALEKQGARGAE